MKPLLIASLIVTATLVAGCARRHPADCFHNCHHSMKLERS